MTGHGDLADDMRLFRLGPVWVGSGTRLDVPIAAAQTAPRSEWSRGANTHDLLTGGERGGGDTAADNGRSLLL